MILYTNATNDETEIKLLRFRNMQSWTYREADQQKEIFFMRRFLVSSIPVKF